MNSEAIKPLKLLWISLSAPCSKSQTAGEQTFNYYIKNFLNDKSFDVTLISTSAVQNREVIKKESEQVEHYFYYQSSSNIQKFKRIVNLESAYNIFNRNANQISNTLEDFILSTLKKLKNKGRQFELIILEWTAMVFLASKIKKIFPQAKLVASEHDVTFIGYDRKRNYYSGIQKLIWEIKYKREKRLELMALKNCDLILPHNPDNISVLREEGLSTIKMQWLVPYFNNMSQKIQRHPQKSILFFGAMSRPENYLSAIWFIENVFNRLDNVDAEFVILGSNPNEQIMKYRSERIKVTGYVDSIIPYFEDAICFVAPLVLGAGIKVKVLEAFSTGVPVLTNQIGIEGIPAKNGTEYIHCETAEEYIQVIRDIFSKKKDVNIIGENAKAFVEKSISLENSIWQYKQALIKLVDKID